MTGGGTKSTEYPSAWLIVRRDGTVVTAERRACDLIGAPDPDSLTGREWWTLMALPESPEVRDVARAFTSGGTWDGALRFRYARQEVTLAASVAPVARSSELMVLSLRDAHGEPSPTSRRTAPEEASSAAPGAEAPVAEESTGQSSHPALPRMPQPGAPSRPPGTTLSEAETTPAPAASDLKAIVSAYDAIYDLDDPVAVARSVLQSLETALGFDWAAVLRYTQGVGRIPGVEVVATYPTPMAGVTRGATWSHADDDESLVHATGEPSMQGALQPASGGTSPLHRLPAFGLRSRILVPLYAGTEVAGALALFRTGPRAFTAAEGILAERTVRRLGDALRRSTDAPSAAETSPSSATSTPPAATTVPGESTSPEPATPPAPPEAPAGSGAQMPPPPATPPWLDRDETPEKEGSFGGDPPGTTPPPAASTSATPPSTPALASSARGVHDGDASVVSSQLESLGEVVAGVAHELNNPLTAILGYAQILGALEGQERDHALRTIEDEAQRAARIVRNLLSFARQRPGQQRLVNLEEVLRRVIDLRRYALEMDEVNVVTRFDMVPEVMVDEGQFEQVFLNLLNNAQQTLQGRGGEVAITTWEHRDRVYVSFADDGPGVPEPMRSRIFEPFFTTREVGHGQGMGLAIVYGVVTQHGGRAWVESNTSGGATFVVEVPLPERGVVDATVEAPDTGPTPHDGPIDGGPTKAGVSGPTSSPSTQAAPRRVLVVDDEGPIRALTREILVATGLEVDTTDGGEEALQLLAEHTYDGVITDLRMPGMDGASLYGAILDRWPAMRDRILFVTGDIEGHPNGQSVDPTSVRYLEKPFTTSELLAAVEEILEGRPTTA